LYGFAGGDPVNFSDPFGLCPFCLPAIGTAVGTAEGAAAAAAAAAAATILASKAHDIADAVSDIAGSTLDALRRGRPQVHHIATDKNRVSSRSGGPWTPRFEPLFERAGVSMNSLSNKTIVFGHRGPHPEGYHRAVYNSLVQATEGLDGDQYRRAFLNQLHVLAVQIATPGTDLNRLATRP
jgi:hypothetical protein